MGLILWDAEYFWMGTEHAQFPLKLSLNQRELKTRHILQQVLRAMKYLVLNGMTVLLAYSILIVTV